MKKKRGLVSCIQEFKKDTILTPIFVIGEVAFDVLIPMMTGRLLTQGVEAGNMERIFYYGGIVVLMALAALLLGALSGRYAARAATGFSRNLRREMYQNVQKFSFSNIDKFSTGGIITRLTTDVTNVQMAFMMIIRIAVRCPIMLICAWVLTFTINPRLALVFLVVIPILGLGLFFIMTGAHPIFERVFKRYDHLNNVVQENLLGLFQGGKAHRLQHAAHAVVRLCVYSDRVLAERPSGSGRQHGCGAAHQYVQLYHDDPHEPDDALHGAGHDHPGPRLRRAYYRAAQRGERPAQRGESGGGGQGRLCSL